ncbi:glutamate synthase-related protein, partial [Staphylococcus epidermidis]|uniref:glutamate synthase-related protein n=1 Tax=Staphylococcus epidermidis TaxID=1282 RepID=UPI0037DA1752
MPLPQTHQTLKLNHFPTPLKLQTHPNLLTPKHLPYPSPLPPQQFPFPTPPLLLFPSIIITLSHNHTSPLPLPTQNKHLTPFFTPNPHHLLNFIYFIAEQLRQIFTSLA